MMSNSSFCVNLYNYIHREENSNVLAGARVCYMHMLMVHERSHVGINNMHAYIHTVGISW